MSRGSIRKELKSSALHERDDRREPGPVERVFMGISIVFTLVLFSYVAWQAVSTPSDADPQARLLDTQVITDGDVRVRVELTNDGGRGLLAVDVDVACDAPPPTLTFNNVPADGRRVGMVVCPPGTEAPSVSVASFIEA